MRTHSTAVHPLSSSLVQRTTADRELDEAFDRLVEPFAGHGSRPLKIVIPGDALSSSGPSLAQLLADLVEDYEEIDSLLDALHDDGSPGVADLPTSSGSATADGAAAPHRTIGDAIAFVSSSELSDPLALSRAVEPLQMARTQLDIQWARVRQGLARLDVYRLSRMPSHQLMPILRQQDHLESLQVLVDFLRSLNRAADAFEALALPRPHIRDFLKHLADMPDWQEMGHLVHVLESAVQGALRPSS